MLPRSTEGAFPLLGSALCHLVPYLPTVMAYYVLTSCWTVAKAATLVAGARLAFVLDRQPDWSHSDHTQNRSIQQHLPVVNAVLHFWVGHIVSPSLTYNLSISLQMIYDHFIGQLIWTTENVYMQHFVIGIYYDEALGQQACFVMQGLECNEIVPVIPL